jgi:hypothetical protein
MKMMRLTGLLVFVAAMTLSASAGAVMTAWGPANDPAGVTCSATATVSLFDSTTLDVKLTNTSPLTTVGSNQVSPWITELDFNLPAHFNADNDIDTTNSSVKALVADSVVFSNGKTHGNYNPVVATLIDRTLDWSYNIHGSHAEEKATDNSNNNALFSLSALSSNIPIVTQGGGFLSDAFSGAEFDTIHFYIKVKNGSFTASDVNFYEDGNLILHFQSGLDSIWLENHDGGKVPEPSTLLLLAGGMITVGAGIIRKKLRK